MSSVKQMLYPKNHSQSTKSTKDTKEIRLLYCTSIHPLGDDPQRGISLYIFVLFVFFVDQMIF